MCMSGGCGGSNNSFTPRTPTSKPYTPVKKTFVHRQGGNDGPQGSNPVRNPFGQAKIRFSGKK